MIYSKLNLSWFNNNRYKMRHFFAFLMLMKFVVRINLFFTVSFLFLFAITKEIRTFFTISIENWSALNLYLEN